LGNGAIPANPLHLEYFYPVFFIAWTKGQEFIGYLTNLCATIFLLKSSPDIA